MFDSKSPIVRFVGYAIIGFFLLIIIISFGMPDFISGISTDPTSIAMVNGKKVHALDFLRYRDSRFRNLRGKEMDDMILNNYIQEVLLLQYAEKLGFASTDEYLMNNIKKMDDFRDPSTGKYSPERLKLILESNRMSFPEFYKLIKNDTIKRSFYQHLNLGLAIPYEDVHTEFMASGSKLKIQYAFLPIADLKKQNAARLAVSDDEVSEEMKKNAQELKDPKTDRARIRSKLEKRKLDALQDEIIEKINAMASSGGSFASAAAILRGQQGFSAEFKIGDQPREDAKEGKPLSLLASSPIFRESCLTMGKGVTSQVIKTPSGLYIFTPVLREIRQSEPDEKELTDLRQRMEYERMNSISMNLMQRLNEESRVIKNLNPDQK